MITGFFLAWTGWMVTVLNQYKVPYCSTFAVATCAQLYGERLDPMRMAFQLGIGEEGLMMEDLRKLPYGITFPKYVSDKTGEVIKQLMKGPLIMSFNNAFGEGHAACAVGYNKVGRVVSANYGTGYMADGYTVIPYSETGVRYQKLTGLGKVKIQATWTGVVRTRTYIPEGYTGKLFSY